VKNRRRDPTAVALVLVASLICSPTWSMEPPFEIVGSYTAVLETGTTAGLTLEENGSAQYVVRWLEGEDSNILGKFSVHGRWTTQGNTLTLIFPNQFGIARVVYEVSPCLSYKSLGNSSCSPGLHVVASDLPSNRTWELWKTELLKL